MAKIRMNRKGGHRESGSVVLWIIVFFLLAIIIIWVTLYFIGMSKEVASNGAAYHLDIVARQKENVFVEYVKFVNKIDKDIG